MRPARRRRRRRRARRRPARPRGRGSPMTVSLRSRVRARGYAAAVLASVLVAPATTYAAATIVIQNGNAAGVGFNDPTPAAPVGGNPGTTLGQQRLNAFQFAANIWGSTLTSVPSIVI